MSSVVVIVILVIGSKLTQGRDALRLLGIRLATIILLGMFAWGYASEKPEAAPDFWPILVSSLVVAGGAHGLLWMILPILAGVYDATIAATVRSAKKAAERREWDRRERESEDERRRKQQQREWEKAQEEERKRQWESQAEDRRQRQLQQSRERYQVRIQFLEEERAANRMDDSEFESACEEAKRRYLKDINEAL